ncbi:MAG: ferric reductase-like transmembrane domain-containing protein [Sediminibacterium sp.]|nr:ferric reductase-like transmembrane domain-containing protein [Sediminibacterium sp.]
MSVDILPILWNRQKKIYDLLLWSIIILYLVVFYLFQFYINKDATFETTTIRAFGTLAILMLHIILSIGPWSRINKKALILLYNRRHFGVSFFLIASVHVVFSILQFHSFGNINPFVSIFTLNTHYSSLYYFPFQTLGFAAYLIFIVMALTSHDYWLQALSPKFWKVLHMLVYLAYGLLIAHVCLGVLEFETNLIYFILLAIGAIILITLHIWAGIKEFKKDHLKLEDGQWVFAGNISSFQPEKAVLVFVNKERVAVFNHNNKLYAVSNVCKHQMGPIGEGKIVDGCITCPWHGYQYLPETGCAPAPFAEKLATYNLKRDGHKVLVNLIPNREGIPGTSVAVEPPTQLSESPFYIGWKNIIPKTHFRFAVLYPLVVLVFMITSAIIIVLNEQKIAQVNYINPYSITGKIISEPFPALIQKSGKDIYGNPNFTVFPIVNAFKFGADSVIANFFNKENINRNQIVTIAGAATQRDKHQIIELTEGLNSITPTKSLDTEETKLILIEKNIRLSGEIIDPKCYFGVMNPGEGKPHKACATLCISGGIMPVFSYLNNNNKKCYAVIKSNQQPLLFPQIKDFIADPIAVKGDLYSFYNWQVFIIQPQSIIRLKN